jgi:hypothetical protein
LNRIFLDLRKWYAVRMWFSIAGMTHENSMWMNYLGHIREHIKHERNENGIHSFVGKPEAKENLWERKFRWVG